MSGSRSSAICELLHWVALCAQGKSGLTVSYLQGHACHHMSPNCCGCHFLEQASAGLTVAKATEDLHAAPSSTGDAQSWRPVVGLVEVAALKGVTYEPGHTTQREQGP